ncbi:hypothetical protein Tco_0702149 [Tanacetum coccineum]|uniref:Xylulose kinase-1 n=1 Tax=Tanacetum coccineum TaxID=301880 RepID=A0ABQ4XWP4_9ASTR
MSNLKFAQTHNLVAFLEKPKESDGFEGIVDFLNASSIRYALTVNPTIYTSCIKQFWATAKAKNYQWGSADTSPSRWEEEPITDEAANAEHVPTHSNDLIFSEITKLKERVKKLERRNKSRTPWLKRLRKVGRSTQVFSSKDEGLGAQDDAFKQGRKIADLDADVEVTLVDEAQGRNDDNLIFDTGVFYKQEVKVEKVVSTTEVTTFDATTTTVDELTLAQTLIEIKAAKPKAVTTTATTTTTTVTRPKAQGVVVQEPTQLNVELEEKEKLAKQREEDANIVEWDNVQAIIDGDYELVERLQEQEQNMARFTHSQLKNKSFDEVQKAFDKTMGWIDSFVTMDSEVVKGDDDQEVAEMKKHMEIVVDEEEIVVDAIPLATKPSIIIDWKIIKEGNMGYFQLIRADGSLRRINKKDTEIPQSSVLSDPMNVVDEAVTKEPNDIDVDKYIYLVNVYKDEDMFGVNDLEGDEVVVESEVADKDVNLSVDEVTLAQALVSLKSAKVQEKGDVIKEPSVPVSAASTKVSIVIPPTATTTITDVSSRPKAKGIVFHEQEQEQEKVLTPIVSSQQPTHVKDKGKGKMVKEKPLKKMSKKELLKLDEELAFKLHAKENEEERLAREKLKKLKKLT